MDRWSRRPDAIFEKSTMQVSMSSRLMSLEPPSGSQRSRGNRAKSLGVGHNHDVKCCRDDWAFGGATGAAVHRRPRRRRTSRTRRPLTVAFLLETNVAIHLRDGDPTVPGARRDRQRLTMRLLLETRRTPPDLDGSQSLRPQASTMRTHFACDDLGSTLQPWPGTYRFKNRQEPVHNQRTKMSPIQAALRVAKIFPIRLRFGARPPARFCAAWCGRQRRGHSGPAD